MDSPPDQYFLSKLPLSSDQCHDMAQTLSTSTSDDIEPVPVQGANSYTVRVGKELVIQFRLEPVDLRIKNLATEIHGTKYIVPPTLLQSDPFYAYSSPYRGKTYCEQGILKVTLAAQKRTLTDLGKFFAQSCYDTRDVMDVNMDTLERYLVDCLNLPEVGEKVQFLIDNLGISSFICINI
jgi:hypothetical protein